MSLADRILGSFERITKSVMSRVSYSFVWEYQVSDVTETSFTGRKVSSDCPFDDMVMIPLMPGIAGTGIKPAVNSIVGVIFLNGDPSKPRVVCWDQTAPVSVTQDTTTTQTFSPSTTRVQITSAFVEVGTGATQFVALSPAVQSFATASITVMAAVGIFATAVGTGTGVGSIVAAATTLNTAITAFSSAVGALVFPATKLKTL